MGYIYFGTPCIYIVGRVFANGPGDLGSIPGRIIPKTLKMVPDTSLLNIQQYKVCIMCKVEQYRERSSALYLGIVAIEKGAFLSHSTTVTNFTFNIYTLYQWKVFGHSQKIFISHLKDIFIKKQVKY